jgi:hypothetical protein
VSREWRERETGGKREGFERTVCHGCRALLRRHDSIVRGEIVLDKGLSLNIIFIIIIMFRFGVGFILPGLQAGGNRNNV